MIPRVVTVSGRSRSLASDAITLLGGNVMRTLTVTTLAAAGLLCLAPGAAAARHYHLSVTGQASELRPATGTVENVRWTVTNTGDGHLDHVRLVATVPNGWTVKDG